MSNVTLSLDNYQYFPGNIIRGQVVCIFRSSKEIKQIRIRFKGEEHTHWADTERYTDHHRKKQRRTVRYHAHNDLILKDEIVHGPGTINAGQHVFPFEFFLPDELPDSFEHTYGKIVYTVKATVERSWKTDFEDQKEIKIKSLIKLQQLSPEFMMPMEYSYDKVLGSCCCAKGLVQMNVTSKKRAFVVGEKAAIKIHVMNMSKVNVETLQVKIKQDVEFTVSHPSTWHKYDTQLIAASYNTGVGAHGERTYDLEIEIPPAGVYNFHGCRLFNSHFTLTISASFSGWHTDLNMTTNIGLGHIPYPEEGALNIHYVTEQPFGVLPATSFAESLPVPMSMPLPPYSPGPSAPRVHDAPSAPSKIDLSENYINSAPPTYQEATEKF